MRIALVLHAFPPHARTGVETYAEALARALGGLGHEVHVFAPRRDDERAYLSLTREAREGYTVTWLALDRDPDEAALRRARPGAAEAFGRFLDREQPEVVHLQHVLRLGAEVVDEARARDLVTVFTAHDPFAAVNDYHLLAPNLAPFEASDLVAQARNERGRGLLDEAFAAHDGYLPPGADDAELAARLDAVLAPRATDRDDADLASRVARLRLERDARLTALARCDRVEAPTRWLAELLTECGLRSRVHVRACGHDVAALRGVPPVDPRRMGPLRVLYLGGLYEVKGAHVLLEAAAPLGDAVQLTLRGCAGTSPYREHLERRAAEVGARLGGAYTRAELPDLLAAADVVALPSIWPENAPFVLREAFAAGRPVIASDTPALRESVVAGRDGRLVAAGDVEAWSAALADLARDRAELAELVDGVRAPKGIDADARELDVLYGDLARPHAERRARARAKLPAHLTRFADRHARLAALSTQELVARALEGLNALAVRLEQPRPELASALRGAERLRERVADLGRAASWRETVARDREAALAALEGRVRALEADLERERERGRWREGILAEREERLQWTESRLADRDAAVQEHEARGAELARSVGALREERDWLRGEFDARGEELAWSRETLEDRAAHLAEAERALRDTGAALEAALAERDELRRGLEAREDELRRLAADHASLTRLHDELEEERQATVRTLEARDGELGLEREAHEGLARAFAELEQAHARLREHEAWLRGELAGFVRSLTGERRRLDEPGDVALAVRAALDGLRALEEELTWRAEEMEGACHDLTGVGERWLRGPLMRRVAAWRDDTDPAGVDA